jgi:hypothetical protein
MLTPKSSDEANTTDGRKIITPEMMQTLSIGEEIKLRRQGWDTDPPTNGMTWQEILNRATDKDGYFYKSPDFHEGMLLENQVPEGDTYIAGTIEKLPKHTGDAD